MKLPNPDKLVVEREKIANYLLNPVHRFGASKARFFTHFGFRVEAWEQLAQAFVSISFAPSFNCCRGRREYL